MPAIAFVLDKPLHHGDRGRFLAGGMVIERPAEGRDGTEGRVFRQVAADLDIRIRTIENAAEQLHNQPVAVKNAGVGLFGGGTARRQQSIAPQIGEHR